MMRKFWLMGLAAGLAGVAGCASGPLPGNPLLADPAIAPVAAETNPLWVPQRPEAYALVFDKTYDVVNEYFDIASSNRFSGEIKTCPLVTAGYFDAFGIRLGCYNCYENLESTFQSVRRFAIVTITPATSSGYYIDVQVFKELEDLPRPTHAAAGAVAYRSDNPIERQYLVVDPFVASRGWIPFGRDHALEQQILARLKECL
jgi:hypothetical protein